MRIDKEIDKAIEAMDERPILLQMLNSKYEGLNKLCKEEDLDCNMQHDGTLIAYNNVLITTVPNEIQGDKLSKKNFKLYK